MKVRDVMKKNVTVVPVGSTYEQAAALMYLNHFSGLPVVDREMNLVGMISEKDLFRALYPRYEEVAEQPDLYHDGHDMEMAIDTLRSTPVEKHMQRKVVTIRPDADIMRAGGLMLAHGIHRLPVVEGGELVGIVTRREIYGSILERNLDLETVRPVGAVSHESCAA